MATDKPSVTEAPADLNKLKPVPPDPQGKAETPTAAAAQPEAPAEQPAGQEGEPARDNTPNPAATPGRTLSCCLPPA